MGKDTKIEWCSHSANLWWGCTKVHSGCDNCYAEGTAKRWGQDVWGNDKPRRLVKGFFNDLKKYQKEAEKAERVDTVFVGSMMGSKVRLLAQPRKTAECCGMIALETSK